MVNEEFNKDVLFFHFDFFFVKKQTNEDYFFFFNSIVDFAMEIIIIV